MVKTSAEAGDNSNSWADVGQFYIGTYSLEPLTITMKQRILLQFLTPLAEYQEVRLRFFSLTASWIQIYILKEFSGTFLVLNSKSNIYGSYNCSSNEGAQVCKGSVSSLNFGGHLVSGVHFFGTFFEAL